MIKKIIVVGGGTAGWLTAAKLSKFISSTSDSIEICVIESPDIPTIGVGEGTWPTMRKTLADLEIDEGAFMRTCSATFKQGTKFINWRQDETPHNASHYYHLFSSAFDPSEFNLAPYWLHDRHESKMSFAETVSIQYTLCELGLAPKKITNKPYEGFQNYAYHLDAAKFADFLKNYCVQKGVKLVSANVLHAKHDEQGFLKTVATDRAGEIAADFFVDCSGFRSLLLGEHLGVPFKSARSILFNDSAIAIQAPYLTDDAPLPCTTLSSAQKAGWIWEISLSNRRGTGHVYSSAHMSSDEAESILRQYIGPIEKQCSAKHIQMKIGYREKFWHKNCVAIGMSAAFVEPLEASAIFLIEASSNMLCDLLPADRDAMAFGEYIFNQSMHYRWQQTIDFIKLHYVLSKRNSPFWQENKDNNTIPDSLKQRIAHWRQHPVSRYEFFSAYEPFPHESYQYVLYGMGYHADIAKHFLSHTKMAREKMAKIRSAAERIKNELPDHRSLLQKVYDYGFQPL